MLSLPSSFSAGMSGEQMASCVAGRWGGGSVTKTSASNDYDNQLPVNLACWQEMASKMCRVLCLNQSTQGGKQSFLGRAEHEMNKPGCAGLLWTWPQVKKQGGTPFNCFIVSLFLCGFFIFKLTISCSSLQRTVEMLHSFETCFQLSLPSSSEHVLWCVLNRPD